MTPFAAYILATMLFGFAYPFLKQHTESWQLVLIAVLYFGAARFGYQPVARFFKRRSSRHKSGD